ncbi:hypothetical protein [Spirosoma validum]|uniref:Uncharacterized protein n=1 Tax=Spirosoma validum TaxID=2771355 RepID=A0A927GCX5_9BACT|nr:hypothetical protein [Spirosoma validum]MBD2753202.1 hypothetical protein [Spirosoma validum]
MSNHSLSQEYISHLRRKVKHAERTKKYLTAVRDTKKGYSDNTVTWYNKLKVYFDNVEATEKLSEKVFEDIDKLAAQAQTVNANVEQIVEAIRLLVCNVRMVSQSLDRLTQKYQSLKNEIDNTGMGSKDFKPNVFMAEFNKLGGDGGKLNKASIACADALTKALDLLKAIYILHYGMDSSRTGDIETYRITRVLDESVTVEEDKILYTTIFETIDAKILGRDVKIPGGLEWLLAQLRNVLSSGVPQPDPDPDGDHYPCDTVYQHIPHFPLSGTDRYYSETKKQYEKARRMMKTADDQLTLTQKDLQRAESSFDGLSAALKSAEEAKNQTKK